MINLASAHRLASGPYVGGASTAIGYGSLAITVGDESFDVEIPQDANTLEDIRDAINDSSDNTGVQATLLNGTQGTRLILTSRQTGAEHAIKVAASGGDGGLAALNYDPNGTMNLQEMDLARDALVHISGFPVSSSTNSIDEAIEGVTINLLKAEEDAEFTLTVGFDSASVTTRIQSFVTEYNNMQAQLTKLGSYDAASKTGGPLLGDALLQKHPAGHPSRAHEPRDRHRRRLHRAREHRHHDDCDGHAGARRCEVEQGALRRSRCALRSCSARRTASRPACSRRSMRAWRPTAISIARNTTLKRQLDDVSRDKEALALRMEQIEARYRKQFTALDGLLSQLQTTSSYLAQQLASVPKAGS